MNQVVIRPAPTAPSGEGKAVRGAGVRLGKRLLSTGVLRFAGWWSIFAGALALNSVCPVCGSTACPLGIGTTGIIAGILAAARQWGGRLVKAVAGTICGFGSGGREKSSIASGPRRNHGRAGPGESIHATGDKL